MAAIIPADNTQFTTPGEAVFYAFLRDALKPDSQCYAWYSPSVNGLEPDFVLYTPEVGLVIFEVKDWVLGQIREADQHTFSLLFPDGREERRTHPLQQARKYMFAIQNRIKASCPPLLSSDLRYKGKIRIPIECAVVFSNITRADFCNAGLHAVVPLERALFADDIAAAQAFMNEPDAASAIKAHFARMLPPRFPFQLSDEDLAALRDVLWPSVRIALPERAGRLQNHAVPQTIQRLDARQESLARRLDAFQAIIRGPAGSGKTLVLVHKAIQAYQRLRQDGSDMPVLLVCFNLTLVHYLKRLLAAYRAPMGPKGIMVTHFYALCHDMLPGSLRYENEDAAYYAEVTQRALEAVPEARKYGAVFVDEGQDFSDAMMDVLKGICEPEVMFWIACDTAQALYESVQQWQEDKAFRIFSLPNPYRATRALTAFCEFVAGNQAYGHADMPEISGIFSVQTETGDAACLRHVKDMHQGAACILARIDALHEAGVPYSEMMVLYTSRQYEGMDDLPLFLQDALAEHGILASLPARDAQSKAGWDITTDSVTISTIHSMKGMDAEAVFVVGLDALEPGHAPSPDLLAYVACSRARRFLEILYIRETPLVAAMKQAAGFLP